MNQWEAKVCAAGPTVRGIDVSKWQGSIDWGAVASSGIEFAFIRISDGQNYIDQRFNENWAGAKNAGILRGAYQFFRPGQDPIAQADLFLDRMGNLNADDLNPVIDVEDTDGQPPSVVADKVGKWIDRVEAATGRKPIIYTGKYFWQDSVRSDDFSDYPLWIAQWGPLCPDLPDAWSHWAFFQTSATGRVPGISGDVDLDLFNGSYDDLLAFAGAGGECGDGICGGGEDPDSCIEDCPPCDVISARGGTIDDADDCFEAGGDPKYIRQVNDTGYAGGLKWTYVTDFEDVANFGKWNLFFEQAGTYEVEVHIPAPYGQSELANYIVKHATAKGDSARDTAMVNQSTVDGWVSLGEFDFRAGGNQHVRINDNTGELHESDTQLALDAVRVTRLDIGEDEDDDDDTDDFEDDSEEVGGGCSTSGSSSTPWLACLGLAVALGRRRRRQG
jgi:uncharacterized protein (TIGR03382 family)